MTAEPRAVEQMQISTPNAMMKQRLTLLKSSASIRSLPLAVLQYTSLAAQKRIGYTSK